MTVLDLVIIALIAYALAMGSVKGFVRESFSLASIFIALIVAGLFYRSASSLFKDVVRTENLALFLGFSLLFVGTLLAGFLGIWLIARFRKFAKVEWPDRCLGAAFGFIRGWVLGAIVFLALTAFNVQAERVRSSGLAPYFLPGSRVIALLTPSDMKARFLVGYRSVEQSWREQL